MPYTHTQNDNDRMYPFYYLYHLSYYYSSRVTLSACHASCAFFCSHESFPFSGLSRRCSLGHGWPTLIQRFVELLRRRRKGLPKLVRGQKLKARIALDECARELLPNLLEQFRVLLSKVLEDAVAEAFGHARGGGHTLLGDR